MNFMDILLNNEIEPSDLLKQETVYTELMQLVNDNRTKFSTMGLDIPTIRDTISDGMNQDENRMLNWTKQQILRNARRRKADLAGQSYRYGALERYTPDKDNPFTLSLMMSALQQIQTEDNQEVIQKVIDGLSPKETTGTTHSRKLLRREETLLDIVDSLKQNLEISDSQIKSLYDDKILNMQYLLTLSEALRGENKKVHPDILELLKDEETLLKFTTLLNQEGLSLPQKSKIISSWKRLESRRRDTIHKVRTDVLSNQYTYRKGRAKRHIRVIDRKLSRMSTDWDNLVDQVTDEEVGYSWDKISEAIDREWEEDTPRNQRERDKTIRLGNKKDEIVSQLNNIISNYTQYLEAKYRLIQLYNEKERDSENYESISEEYSNHENDVYNAMGDVRENLMDAAPDEADTVREFRRLMQGEEE